ncbi:MAG: haloacid dehalogenase type II [Alphaproteobacteria bacterium]|nr:haloacid dehalogenase type II [Alphaproteobacteria bacterium]
MRLSDFKVLTFDCYGTLIDWESGLVAALKPLARRAKRKLTRNEILEAHARHESSQQRYTPARLYRDLLPIVYKRLAEEWGVEPKWQDAVAYGRSIGKWPAFADSAKALKYLKQHYKLVILSNVDNESFARSNVKLGVKFDAIMTAQDIGTYKPNRRNFAYLLEKLAGMGIARHEILHTAESLFHDHQPANEFGLASCWIHRRHADEGFGATMNPGTLPRYDFRFTSMAEMAAVHRSEQ